MQEIIILNSKYESSAKEIARAEKKSVLVCYNFSNDGILFTPKGDTIVPFRLSKVIMIKRGKGFSGSQYALTNKNMPQERAVGYVL